MSKPSFRNEKKKKKKKKYIVSLLSAELAQRVLMVKNISVSWGEYFKVIMTVQKNTNNSTVSRIGIYNFWKTRKYF